MKRLLFALSILAGGVLRADEFLLLTLQYPPYEYQEGGKGEIKGVAVEIVRQAFVRMGHTVNVRILPWPRVLWMVENGEADGFFTAYRTPEREKWADYSSEELVPQVTSLFVKKGSGITYKGDLAQLAAQPIGVVMKVSYGTKFDQAVRDNVLTRVMESVDGETNFRQLFAGRLKVVASNRLGAHFILNQMGRSAEVEELSPPLDTVPSYIAFSKQRNLKALRDRFDQTLRQMKADGTWARIMKQAGN